MTQSTLLQRRALLLLTIAFMVFMFSCKKDPGKIGLELMGENDLDVAHTDTLPLIAYAVPIDSIRTDEGSVSVMGSFCDPTFGTTTSNLVATLWMTRNNPNFGIFPTADSIVAYLDYYGTYYGNIATTQQVEVFELDEKIIFDSTYYSNRRCQHKPNPVGSVAFTPMPTDSVLNPDSTLGRARLRIPLNTGFGQMILDADTSDLKDNITFTEFMKGLLFRFHPITTPGEGALLDMNMVSLRSEVVLYYHNSEDTTTFTMRCSTFTPRYLEVDHDFSTGDPLFVQQLEGDTTLGEEKLYLQGLGGVKTR
ncbi:MAG: hypothetical protein CSA04_00260 [Bacteroidetes bacterium]|nr:MAG: hypothetical protein CSA04_00260 [Bacteroidota bacterium]